MLITSWNLEEHVVTGLVEKRKVNLQRGRKQEEEAESATLARPDRLKIPG